MSRKRIFEIIEKSDGIDRLSAAYDFFMISVIIISLIPLAFKNESGFLFAVDKAAAVVFIIDYLLRWLTADYKFEKSGAVSFVRYPFSTMALIDLVSILPSFSIISNGFKVLRVLRMIRALRVIRVFKAMRYSKSFESLNLPSPLLLRYARLPEVTYLYRL